MPTSRRPMGMAWSPKLAVGVQSIDMQHQELFVRVDALLDALASQSLAVQLNRRLGDWLLDHIGQTDRALGAFLQKKGAARATLA